MRDPSKFNQLKTIPLEIKKIYKSPFFIYNFLLLFTLVTFVILTMFRKVLIPSALKLSGPRSFATLTRHVTARVNPGIIYNKRCFMYV